MFDLHASAMRFSVSGLLFLALILLPVPPAEALDIDALNARLETANATWRAAPNPINDRFSEKAEFLTGAPGILEMREEAARRTDKVAPLPEGGAPAAILDWRDNNGDYVTGVRNQMNCGSCWAFSATAALESRTLISNSTPGGDLDLSEQISLSCTGGSNDCGGGYIGDVSDFLRDSGTSYEACYPYQDGNGDCANACDTDQLFKFTSWGYATTGQRTDAAITALKNAVTNNGPVVVWMNATDEFAAYGSGVFQSSSPTSGTGHFVLLIGWNSTENAFLAKNSWSTAWGEDGFFRIAESELKTGETKFGIFSAYYAGATFPSDDEEATVPGLTLPGSAAAAVFLFFCGAAMLKHVRR